MTNRGQRLLVPALGVAVLAGCSTPSYVDLEKGTSSSGNPFSQVEFRVDEAYRSDPPDCVAVLPFEAPINKGTHNGAVSFDQAEAVRRAFYAQLAPQGKRDIEIPRIEFVLGQLSPSERKDFHLIGNKLSCGALITGEVTEYGSQFLGIYSRVSVGANLKMIRASDSRLLWEGRHIAVSHGGTIPLSPVGIAMGILQAATNIEEEQLFRVVDDLARRLVTTIPDNRIAVAEEPLSTVSIAATKTSKAAPTVDGFLADLADKPQEARKEAILGEIAEGRFDAAGTRRLYAALIALDPADAEAPGRYARYLVDQGDYAAALEHAERSLALNRREDAMQFLKARILIKLDDLDGADRAIVEAVALGGDNAQYLRGLGYVNSLKGNHERALAAYRLALKLDPLSGFANYNAGVTYYTLGDFDEAAVYFYQAGLAYYRSHDYGQVEKTLADLKELAATGHDLAEQIDTLEAALEALIKGEKKNGNA